MLFHLLFTLNFLNLVMNYVTLVTFTILVNGLTSYFFKLGRGLTQGFPLSPFPFFLVAKGSNTAMIEAKND